MSSMISPPLLEAQVRRTSASGPENRTKAAVNDLRVDGVGRDLLETWHVKDEELD